MKNSRLFLSIALIASSVLAQDLDSVKETLQKGLGSEARSFFSDVYTVANEATKNDLLDMARKIKPIDENSVQRVKKILRDYTRIEESTQEYNTTYKGKLESPSMEKILMKRAIEDLKASKTSNVVIVKGLKSYKKDNVSALLTFMEFYALENVNGIEIREKLFFDQVRKELGLGVFDMEFCVRVLGDKCRISNSTAQPLSY